jgi:hypothetical protein
MSDQHPCTGPTPALVADSDLLRCTSCGAFQRLNPESGNVTWIRSGRVISAPEDMITAKRRHDERYGTDYAGS